MIDYTKRLIIDLDGLPFQRAFLLMNKLIPEIETYRLGNKAISTLHIGEFMNEVARDPYFSEHKPQFLFDGRYCDIDQTVATAATRLAEVPAVSMLTVHCSGSGHMIAATKAAVIKHCGKSSVRPLVLGITILDSLNPFEGTPFELSFKRQEMVVGYAFFGKAHGLDGVIALPPDIRRIRDRCGRDFIIVAELSGAGETISAATAIEWGADYVIIPHSALTALREPLRLIEQIEEEIVTSLRELEKRRKCGQRRG